MSKLYSLSAMLSVKDLDPMGKMQDFNSEWNEDMKWRASHMCPQKNRTEEVDL